MNHHTKKIAIEILKLKELQVTQDEAIKLYNTLIESVGERRSELEDDITTFDSEKARLRREETALIDGLEALKTDQDKVIKDQSTLDSQINKYEEMVLEISKRATEAKDFEAKMLEDLISEGVDKRLNKMMKESV